MITADTFSTTSSSINMLDLRSSQIIRDIKNTFTL